MPPLQLRPTDELDHTVHLCVADEPRLMLDLSAQASVRLVHRCLELAAKAGLPLAVLTLAMDPMPTVSDAVIGDHATIVLHDAHHAVVGRIQPAPEAVPTWQSLVRSASWLHWVRQDVARPHTSPRSPTLE